KDCAEIFPKMFLDIHNSCVTSKLRDFIYVLENLPLEHCRTRPRIILLKRKARTLYEIISRACFRVWCFLLRPIVNALSLITLTYYPYTYHDLVFLTNDCEALDTGISQPRYTEDTLQLLEETI
ncbi:hypothetical protein QTP70_032385, partial [Hemibagrus guttatus]